eukprot:14125696-Ditylum_brightwellii.AAC.1
MHHFISYSDLTNDRSSKLSRIGLFTFFGLLFVRLHSSELSHTAAIVSLVLSAHPTSNTP